jgi:hypothetical protein
MIPTVIPFLRTIIALVILTTPMMMLVPISFIPNSSFDINDDGGLSDGEEDELPMFETESVSSCADDYDIGIDPDALSSEPMPIHALLDWYKEHIATGFPQLSMSPELKCKIELLVLPAQPCQCSIIFV